MQKISVNIAISFLLLIALIITSIVFSISYNNLVSAEEKVLGSWSQVESNYQRRADLVPNLIKTVKAYAEQELKAINTVTDSRNASLKELIKSTDNADKDNMTAINAISKAKNNLNDEQIMKEILEQQQSANKSLTAMIVMAEAYPNLRSADNFLMLQDQLEGTENRINNARMIFNENVSEFNALIRKIPNSLMANIGNFKRKAYFKSDDGSNKTVNVNF